MVGCTRISVNHRLFLCVNELCSRTCQDPAKVFWTEDPLRVCFHGSLWTVVRPTRSLLSSRKKYGQQISPDRPHKQSRHLGVCIELEKESCIFVLLCPLVPSLSTIHAAAQTILLLAQRIWKERRDYIRKQ